MVAKSVCTISGFITMKSEGIGSFDMTIREKAFRRIQNDSYMYRLWNQAKTESVRVDLLIREAYMLGLLDMKFAQEGDV